MQKEGQDCVIALDKKFLSWDKIEVFGFLCRVATDYETHTV